MSYGTGTPFACRPHRHISCAVSYPPMGTLFCACRRTPPPAAWPRLLTMGFSRAMPLSDLRHSLKPPHRSTRAPRAAGSGPRPLSQTTSTYPRGRHPASYDTRRNVWRNGCVWCCMTSRSFSFAVVSWSSHSCFGSNHVVGARTVRGCVLGYLKKGPRKGLHRGMYGQWAYSSPGARVNAFVEICGTPAFVN